MSTIGKRISPNCGGCVHRTRNVIEIYMVLCFDKIQERFR